MGKQTQRDMGASPKADRRGPLWKLRGGLAKLSPQAVLPVTSLSLGKFRGCRSHRALWFQSRRRLPPGLGISHQKHQSEIYTAPLSGRPETCTSKLEPSLAHLVPNCP